MNQIDKQIHDYYQWLKDRTFVHTDEETGWHVINTPFIGVFNDGIDIYVKNSGNKVKFSDDGETVSNLDLQGVSIVKTRKVLFDNILTNYGIKYNNGELTIETDLEKFAQAKHNLISAIQEINDFNLLSKNNVNTLFKEDVRNYLNEIDVIYTPDFISKGQTGLEFNFDFQIAKKTEEIVLKSFSRINNSNLGSFLFSWEDIKSTRERIAKKNVKAVAIINDFSKTVRPEFLEALKSKDADYILWSEKDTIENKNKLVA